MSDKMEIEEVEKGVLPGKVYLKSKHASLNHHHYAVIHKGKVFTKAYVKEDPSDRYENIQPDESPEWRLVSEDGLPHPGYWTNGHNLIQWPSGWFPIGFTPTEEVAEVSVDGDSLVLIGKENRIIYWMRWKYGFKEYWQARWGLLLGEITPQFITDLDFHVGPPGWVRLPDDILSWGISRRYWYNDYYEDIEGNPQDTDIGVTSLFVLKKTGTDIKYIDPWLTPRFSHRVDLPVRNRFIAVRMSVAGSLLFVISATGRMYTRLIDFDTEGHNPFLEYRWVAGPSTMRRLPSEGWLEQPRLPQNAQVSAAISILQCGKGNANRELRVLGRQNGHLGYFYKKTFEPDWSFFEESEVAPVMDVRDLDDVLWLSDNVVEELSHSMELYFKGTINHNGKDFNVEITEFNPYCSPAKMRIEESSGDGEVELELHLLAPEEDDDEGHISHWNAVLLLDPDEYVRKCEDTSLAPQDGQVVVQKKKYDGEKGRGACTGLLHSWFGAETTLAVHVNADQAMRDLVITPRPRGSLRKLAARLFPSIHIVVHHQSPPVDVAEQYHNCDIHYGSSMCPLEAIRFS